MYIYIYVEERAPDENERKKNECQYGYVKMSKHINVSVCMYTIDEQIKLKLSEKTEFEEILKNKRQYRLLINRNLNTEIIEIVVKFSFGSVLCI